jgi:TDG/mug DNA glycosylase family protein
VDRETIAVYEAGAREWRDRRPARFVERAAALAASVPDGEVRLDAGCGAGLHLPTLGEPVVALDGAFSMLELARSSSPRALPVQADLEWLPLRDGAVHGSWARASYLHVPREHLPWALLQLHRALAVGAPGAFTLRHGDGDGPITDDDFPGRRFVDWRPEPLRDVFVGAGFDIDELAVDRERDEWIHARVVRSRTLPDYVGPGMRLLVCGLNPSVYAADRGVAFARPGNRFWPAALAAGLVERDRDPQDALWRHGIGFTDLVKRASARADVLTVDEYRDGMARVARLVEWLRPGAVCFLGLTGWRAVVDKRATAGEQPEGIGGAPAYVMPNPSGVNGHASLADLTEHLRAAITLSGDRGRPNR